MQRQNQFDLRPIKLDLWLIKFTLRLTQFVLWLIKFTLRLTQFDLWLIKLDLRLIKFTLWLVKLDCRLFTAVYWGLKRRFWLEMTDFAAKRAAKQKKNQPRGVQLEYRVRAINKGGESSPSNTISVVLWAGLSILRSSVPMAQGISPNESGLFLIWRIRKF